MWGKKEQFILWVTAYLPFILIIMYRFIDGNDFFKKTKWALWLSEHLDKILFDFIIIIGIIVFSLFIYRLVTNWLFNDYDNLLKAKEIGKNISVRKYERLNVNDYSFFLMTLLLPLVSIDHASVVNLVVTFMIIVIVIFIWVKTDSISACPLFFTSGRHVYRAVISDQPKEVEALDPLSRMDVIIITCEKNLDLNHKFRVQKLVNNVFYLAAK